MNLTEPHVLGPECAQSRGKLATTAAHLGTKIFITYGDHEMTDNIVHLVLARCPMHRPARAASRCSWCRAAGRKARWVRPATSLRRRRAQARHERNLRDEFAAGEGAVGYLVGEENRGLNVISS
jgi:hypothetical protein